MTAGSSLNFKQRKTVCDCGRPLRLTNTDGVCGACALKNGAIVGVLGQDSPETRSYGKPHSARAWYSARQERSL